MQTYLIHDNGGLPFKVEVINNKTIRLYESVSYDEKTETDVYELVEVFTTDKVFIGFSPFNEMTEFSGGHGSDFDGNTILFHLQGLQYVFIGSEVFVFLAKSEIIQYVSPVGNNDVPYPYAKDVQGNLYLFIEDIILINPNININNLDPYNVYYENKKNLVTEPLQKHLLYERNINSTGNLLGIYNSQVKAYKQSI